MMILSTYDDDSLLHHSLHVTVGQTMGLYVVRPNGTNLVPD
jgi:hypothetical protein